VPEGLSAAEVGKEIAEHTKHATDGHARRDRVISIAEAVLLSIVALLAAWSGYSAAKWGTDSSISLATASATRTKANRADIVAGLPLHRRRSPAHDALATVSQRRSSRAPRVA
jgi:hypothetical protein